VRQLRFWNCLHLVTCCFFLALVGTVICLLRMKWGLALCYFLAAFTVPASAVATAALNDDRFVLPSKSHQEIADIYNRRRVELFDPSKGVRPIPLDVQCHPPSDCECWLLLDPNHTSGAEKEVVGGWLNSWHRPAWSFPIPANLAIVDVRRLGDDAFSVLGCEIDWTSFKPA
jgi:hypothetical protein